MENDMMNVVNESPKEEVAVELPKKGNLQNLFELIAYIVAAVGSLFAAIACLLGSMRAFDMTLSLSNLFSFFGNTGFYFKNGFKLFFLEGFLAYLFFLGTIAINVFAIVKSVQKALRLKGLFKESDNKKADKTELKELVGIACCFNAMAVLICALTSGGGLSPLGSTALIIFLVVYLVGTALISLITSFDESGKLSDKSGLFFKCCASLIKIAWYILFVYLTLRPGMLSLKAIFKFADLSWAGLIEIVIDLTKVVIAADVIAMIMLFHPSKELVYGYPSIFVLRVIQSALVGSFDIVGAFGEVLPGLLLAILSMLYAARFAEENNLLQPSVENITSDDKKLPEEAPKAE